MIGKCLWEQHTIPLVVKGLPLPPDPAQQPDFRLNISTAFDPFSPQSKPLIHFDGRRLPFTWEPESFLFHSAFGAQRLGLYSAIYGSHKGRLRQCVDKIFV
eukprot:gnl/TRDRNA2_/TRDRNA2_6839_c0_seq1.p1 gnl/TRDRNA2_/TRDRNA2_6839_c0~~gnl/TRDRNA2_/TRDRNA2_6839_c0_seq1.p1  ORF type:complete len:101 (+),score=2.46 gnl/TRDRNA2_/TRDRNA2_6839_c0_seq1:2-304(+)